MKINKWFRLFKNKSFKTVIDRFVEMMNVFFLNSKINTFNHNDLFKINQILLQSFNTC